MFWNSKTEKSSENGPIVITSCSTARDNTDSEKGHKDVNKCLKEKQIER